MHRWASRRCCCFVRSKHGVRQICPLRHLSMDNPQRRKVAKKVSSSRFATSFFKTAISSNLWCPLRRWCHPLRLPCISGCGPAVLIELFLLVVAQELADLLIRLIALGLTLPGALRATGFCPAQLLRGVMQFFRMGVILAC